jgi:carbon storage regulator
MLVLSRKLSEQIVIGSDITITVVKIMGDKVRLGIEAPSEIPVHRLEIKQAIEDKKKHFAQVAPAWDVEV